MSAHDRLSKQACHPDATALLSGDNDGRIPPLSVPPNLWGLHGQLLDITKFYERHPGGSHFLARSRGVDISVMYEACHSPSTDAKRKIMLKEYVVDSPPSIARDSTVAGRNGPTVSPQTGNVADWNILDKDCFYQRMRRRVWSECSPHDFQLIYDSVIFAIVVAFYVTLFALALKAELWTFGQLVACAFVNGPLRAMVFGAGHVYIHTKRRQFVDIFVDYTLTSSFRWARTHIFLHHPFTNQAPRDVDHTSLARLREWPVYRRYLYIGLENIWKRFVEGIDALTTAPETPPLRSVLIRLHFPAEFALFYFSGALGWWALSWVAVNVYYQSMLLAGHYTDSCQLNGKHFRDWAMQQILVSNDFKITGIPSIDVFISVGLSEHTCHHLFPTFNPLSLVRVNNIVWEMCKEEGVPRQETPYLWDLWPDMYHGFLKSRKGDKV